jgi:hypothetical protein
MKVINNGNYAFCDAESFQRFEPGEVAECQDTSWMRLQISERVFSLRDDTSDVDNEVKSKSKADVKK